MKRGFVKSIFVVCTIVIFGLTYRFMVSATESDVDSRILETENIDDFYEANEENIEEPLHITVEQNTTSNIICFLNLKRYETLLDYYKKMEEMMAKKVELYSLLNTSGEITDLYVKQVEMQRQQILSQINICENEIEYNRFVMDKFGLSFGEVDIKTIKKIESMETYCSNETGAEVVNIARYATDCKNAVENINAKEKEVEILATSYEQVKILKDSGEASELDMVEAQLSLIKANIELEEYYYDMNVAYYSLTNSN